MPKQKSKSEYCKHLWKPLGIIKRNLIRDVHVGKGRVDTEMGEEVISIIFCEKCGSWKSRKF